jgi:NaMN:DMB phosphoribosyltransferase
MLAGAMLAAAEARMTLLIDGFIVTAALLVAARVSPAVLDYCVYAHCSNEAGHRRQLDWLQAASPCSTSACASAKAPARRWPCPAQGRLRLHGRDGELRIGGRQRAKA